MNTLPNIQSMNLTSAYLVRCSIQIVIIPLILSKDICWTWYDPNLDIYYNYYSWNYYPKTITPSVFRKHNNSIHILMMLYLVTCQSSIMLLLHYKIRRDHDSRSPDALRSNWVQMSHPLYIQTLYIFPRIHPIPVWIHDLKMIW